MFVPVLIPVLQDWLAGLTMANVLSFLLSNLINCSSDLDLDT